MKKFNIVLGAMALLGTTVLGVCSTYTNNSNNKITNNNAIVRTGANAVEDSNYFDSIVSSHDDVAYKTIAKKYISSEALNGYETVSLFDSDEYLITYEVTTSLDDLTMNLSVYFDNTNEHIIENFIGVPMVNYNDEEDFLFTIDDMHIFLSEFELLIDQEQCSFFGELCNAWNWFWGKVVDNSGIAFHKTVNVAMRGLECMEPAIKALISAKCYCFESGLDVLFETYLVVKDCIYTINYEENSKKTQPSDYVYGQDSYGDWKFGSSDLAFAGCEVIAGYNLAHALEIDCSLAETIFLYESLGIELGTFQGYFGSNPYQISYFLDFAEISYERINNCNALEEKINDSENYYIILSRWNNDGWGSAIHTFMIDKDVNRNYKFKAYNYYGSFKSSTYDRNDYKDYFNSSSSIWSTFICAYFISK